MHKKTRKMTVSSKTFMIADLHLGNLIKAELKAQGRTAVWLAQQVHCTPENIYKVCRLRWVNMSLLFQISEALNHDFFKDCSDYLQITNKQ